MIGQWSKRLISPLGKITVIKSILISTITHLLISLPNPSEETLKKLESDLFQFLWNKKPDKVARKQVIQTYIDGGINMLHVKSFLKSMKISWMKRLLSCNSTWTKILEHILKIKKDLFFTLGPEFSKMVAKKKQRMHFGKIL